MATINNRFENLTLERLQEIYDIVSVPVITTLSVGSTPITGGAVGRILFQGTGNVLQESANLFWDNTNARLGIGTATPLYALDARTTSGFIVAAFKSQYTATGYISTDNGSTWFGVGTDGFNNCFVAGSNFLNFRTNNAQVGRFFSTGNLLLQTGGTFTDAGYKLDVNGTARFVGNIDLTSTSTSIGKGINDAIRFALGEVRVSISTASGRFSVYAPGTDTTLFRVQVNGNVLVGTTTDVASSKLTVESTTQGFLPPRMTSAQKNAIATPASGLVVYDTTLGKLCVRGAVSWETITSI